MAKRAILFVSAVIIALVLTCGRTRTPELRQPTVVQIEEVVSEPEKYADKIITVHGCYTLGFERSTVQPCVDPKLEQLTWVEDAAVIESFSKLRMPTLPDATPIELRTEAKPPLLFNYDDARNQRAWERLRPNSKLRGLESAKFDVTLVGQFETIAPESPKPIARGFGHLNGLQHQLILIDVLSARQLKP